LITTTANFTIDNDGYEILRNCTNVIKKLEKNKVDPAFELGKTFLTKKDRNPSTRSKDEIAEMRKTLRNIVDRIDYCVRQISKVESKINYTQFISILEQKRYVSEIIGIDSSELQTLVNDNYICKDLFSIYLECAIN
jgi:mevalonate kinase